MNWISMLLSFFYPQESTFIEYLESSYKSYAIQHLKPEALPDQFIRLDTRTKEEYNVSHLEHALWVGYNEFTFEKVKHIHKSTPILVYCSVGVRSSEIGLKLIEAGFTNVKNLYGGIFYWVNKNRPIYNGESETKRLHTYNWRWGRFVFHPEVIKVY